MFAASARIGSRYAAPAAATGTLLVLSLSPDVVHAKAEAKTDVSAVKKSIADLIEDDAERRGDGTSLTGTFVRVSYTNVMCFLVNMRYASLPIR